MGIKLDIDVIPTGIDLSKFEKEISTIEKDSLKDRYKIQKDDFIFIFLGRVAKKKKFG